MFGTLHSISGAKIGEIRFEGEIVLRWRSKKILTVLLEFQLLQCGDEVSRAWRLCTSEDGTSARKIIGMMIQYAHG